MDVSVIETVDDSVTVAVSRILDHVVSYDFARARIIFCAVWK